MHADTDVLAVDVEEMPAGQAEHDGAPAPEKYPAGHTLQPAAVRVPLFETEP